MKPKDYQDSEYYQYFANWTIYVIHTCDIWEKDYFRWYSPNGKPRSVKRPKGEHGEWLKTEGQEQAECPYEVEEQSKKWAHAKYTAELTFDQFLKFASDLYLYFDNENNMGMLCDYGHLPALTFRIDGCEHGFVDTWVCPLPPSETQDVLPGFENAMTYDFDFVAKQFEQLIEEVL